MWKKIKKNLGGVKSHTQLFSKFVISVVASRKFFYFTLVLFLVQAVYFAVTIRFGLPPDEKYHFDFIQLFAQNNFSPFLSTQDGFYSLGEATKTPFFLYHYLLAIPYKLVASWQYSYIVLRLINIGIAFGSLLTVVAIAKQLKISEAAKNMSLFLLTNTLMFTFLSSAISYDNLFILLGLLTFYLYLQLKEKLVAKRVLLFSCVIVSGSMIKVTFIPIAGIILVLLVFAHRKKYAIIVPSLKETFAKDKRLNISLSVILILLIGLFSQRYISNLLAYKTYEPKCQEIHSIELCRESALFTRNEAIYGNNRRPADKNVFEYFVGWSVNTINRTFGIYGHEEFNPSFITVGWFMLLVLLLVLLSLKLDHTEIRPFLPLLTVTLLYSLVVFLQNLSIYQAVGRPTFAIHGRYLFVALPLLYLYLSHVLFSSKIASSVRSLLIVGTLVIFFVSTLPTYLQKSNDDWRNKVLAPTIRRPTSVE